ncbi:MAG: Gfo/Idh/MocA family oxidoreductase, partial [Silvibacterium sp.]|nr:Gfo/Idh/MocA family oxidoreductase [Silvibacterium sp.]
MLIRHVSRVMWLVVMLGVWCSIGFAQQPVRVAIVGLEHGHVSGFLHAFPQQHDVELVAVVDPDAGLRAKYEQEFHLNHSLFFSKLDEAVAAKHPEALLVYTPISEHR